MLDRLVDEFKNLAGFENFREKFATLFEEFKEYGIDYANTDGDIPSFYTSLLPHLKSMSAENAYLSLVQMKAYLFDSVSELKEPKSLSITEQRATILLLDTCPNTFNPILRLEPKTFAEKKQEAKFDDPIDISDLIQHDFSFPQLQGCEDTPVKGPNDISSQELPNDSLLKRLQKRLYHHHTYVDEAGTVYRVHYAERKANGAQSIYTTPLASLVSGIDYEFLFRYFFILQTLKNDKHYRAIEKRVMDLQERTMQFHDSVLNSQKFNTVVIPYLQNSFVPQKDIFQIFINHFKDDKEFGITIRYFSREPKRSLLAIFIGSALKDIVRNFTNRILDEEKTISETNFPDLRRALASDEAAYKIGDKTEIPNNLPEFSHSNLFEIVKKASLEALREKINNSVKQILDESKEIEENISKYQQAFTFLNNSIRPLLEEKISAAMFFSTEMKQTYNKLQFIQITAIDNLTHSSEKNTRALKIEVDDHFKQIMNLLLSTIVPGLTYGFTSYARLLLCELFNIRSKNKNSPKRYIACGQALAIDKALQITVENFLKGNFKFSANFQARSLPVYVTPEPKIVTTYGKTLTIKLLAQIAANWFASYDVNLRMQPHYPSRALAEVYQLLNRLNLAENDPVPTPDLKTLLTNPVVRQSIKHDKIAERFCFAISNCVQLKPCIEQKEAKTPVNISQIEAALGIYKKQVDPSSIPKCYANELEKLLPTWQTSCKRGLFRGTTRSIEELEDCVASIKRNHQTDEDFSVNERDLAKLQKVFADRYSRLKRKSGDAKPNNYTLFPKATDGVFMLVALEVEQGLRNLGQNKSAMELLTTESPKKMSKR